MSEPINRYKLKWPETFKDIDIELFMVAKGGYYRNRGLGLKAHMMNARALLWPERYCHDWTRLLYDEFIKNDFTVMMGAASTQKTSTACEYILIKYFASPNNTLVILSTVDTDKLDTGVWAEAKMLWEQARKLWPHLPGNLIDHKRTITTDNIDAGDVRDMRKGILCRPCYVGNNWVGLGKLVGIKQENIIYFGDELQFMAPTFLGSLTNLFANESKGRVQVIGSGNPRGDTEDQLGLAAEPRDGWASVGEPEVTMCWDTKKMGGRCVNLVGTDSPNFRNLAKGGPFYKGLIGPKFAERIAHDYGLDSPQYYSQVRGIMKVGMCSDQVITRQACHDHKAFEKAIWATPATRPKVHGLDPSYGGIDAAVSYILEWGQSPDGLTILRPVLVKVHRFDLASPISVEDQLAEQVYNLLSQNGIPPENSFYDPYGKGTLGFSFAGKFGKNCPIPVNSGGPATDRPVRADLYIIDPVTKQKRLKKCSEHYRKFITEEWFSVRYIVEANQFREFPDDCLSDMVPRKYAMAAGDKIEIEPKDDYKARVGKSPNHGDALAVAVEGARQRGFVIGKLGTTVDNARQTGFEWLAEMRRAVEKLEQSKRLTYA